MKKVSKIKLMLVVVIFAVICSISTVNYATGIDDLIQNITQLEPTNTAQTTPTVPENTVQNIAPITTTNTTNTDTKLPQTGVDDTIMWVLIGVSAVAAVYTYKKVRDYNV